jgi:hypothetical protein
MTAFKIEYLPWWLYLVGLGLITVPLGAMELAKALGFIAQNAEKDESSFAAKLKKRLGPTAERAKAIVQNILNKYNKTIEKFKLKFTK